MENGNGGTKLNASIGFTWLKKPSRTDMALIFCPLIALGLVVWGFYAFGIVLTLTGSVPIGFYRIIQRPVIARGDYVVFCLPDKIATMGVRRGYIPPGRCPNDSQPLIKLVIATPGDSVTVSAHQIMVTHHATRFYYFAPTQARDKQHRLVHRFIHNGTYIAQGIWVYGNHNPRYSWDSRYYGAIQTIDDILAPVWVM